MASRCTTCRFGDKWGPSECECNLAVAPREQMPAKAHVPKKVPCKVHYSGRRCENGNSCQYEHGELPPCKFYLQGNCTHRPCPFPHTGTPQPQARDRDQKKLCRNIAEGRECPFGERCHFSHSS